MGLKAGWLAFFVFVWVIGAFLGSTFEYQNTEDTAGVAYSTGTANFTNGSKAVHGNGTAWSNVTMQNGLIKVNAESTWYKIASVTDADDLVLADFFVGAGGVGLNYTMSPSYGWAGTGTAGYAQAPITKLQYLMNISNAVQRLPLLGNIPMPVPNGEYFNTAFKVLTWQFSFLYDEDGDLVYGLFYWIFIAPFAIMGVLSMLLLVYGVLSGNLNVG